MPESVHILELIGGEKIPAVITGTWIVMGLLSVFGLLARRSLASATDPVVPDERISLRSVGEVLVEWMDGFVRDVTESHHWRLWVPFFGTLFMFILAANFFGLLPGMEPPTGTLT